MEAESSLVRDFAIIMAAAGVAIALFRRFEQPPILGYLLAGLLVGPYTLPHPPVKDTETIRLLSDLGLVILLFALGLEFGWERIRQVGLRVVVIGMVEIAFMMALGYEVGTLFGWTGTESLFLGAALSISSSAVLVKVLRDSGKLHDTSGRLIVGILVVEDFAAVVLLTLLAGVATTGTAELADVGLLAGKLALFAVAALTLGGLIAPRVLSVVAHFRSTETVLVVSLAFCFGLALIAQELGLSAAAGAFLIGTVLGDTPQAREIYRLMSPIRDVFAALFFVSIGMLIDPRLVGQHLVPALAISGVFILGKITANTIGTFFTGHDGRTSLQVGMGMPQLGEFSLAMVKVGAERAAVGGFFYPVMTLTTAITSLLYPYLFKAAVPVAGFLEQRSPRMLRLYVLNLSQWLSTLRGSGGLGGPVAAQVRGAVRAVLLNAGIIMVLVAAGTFTLQFATDLADALGLPESLVGLAVGVSIIALCVPSGVAVWRELHALSEQLTNQLFARRQSGLRRWQPGQMRELLQYSMSGVLVLLLLIWTIPFFSHLLFLGEFSTPLPLAVLAVVIFLTTKTAFKVHGILEATFRRTFLGDGAPRPESHEER